MSTCFRLKFAAGLWLLISALAGSVRAELVTFRVEGEVTAIRREYNILLTNVAPLVLLAPRADLVAELGLEGFEAPRPLALNSDGTFGFDNAPPPIEVVPVLFEVTVDLSDLESPLLASPGFFPTVGSSTIRVGTSEFLFDELTVNLGFSADGQSVERIDLIPGLVEPPPPIELNVSEEQRLIPQISIDPRDSFPGLPLPDTSDRSVTIGGVEFDFEPSSRFYLTGEVVDDVIDFVATSITVVPEPTSFVLVAIATVSCAGFRQRLSYELR